MTEADDFTAVRRDPDPLRRGRRATELLTIYQQRATELARLRREAIEQAHGQGISYTDIASALGITKGRITQIRDTAPGPERAFFGIGPVSIGVPLRYGTDDRERTYIDASDSTAQERMESMLAGLTLTGRRFAIRPTLDRPPAGDAVVICGPKSAPIGAKLLCEDQYLGFARNGDRWCITDTVTGMRHGSPYGDDPQELADLGYLARHQYADRVVVHVAGIHSMGSLGVVHFLAQHLPAVYSQVGERSFSAVIRCQFDDQTTLTDSRLIVGPYMW
jgi:hypothetical protein